MDVSTNAIMGTNGGRRTNKRWPERYATTHVALTTKNGHLNEVAAQNILYGNAPGIRYVTQGVLPEMQRRQASIIGQRVLVRAFIEVLLVLSSPNQIIGSN